MAADQAQYAIDIAARLTSGEATLDQLDELTAKLTAGGKDADYFGEAMRRVDVQLEASRAAALSANSALADGKDQLSELRDAARGVARDAKAAGAANAGIVPEDLQARLTAANAAVREQSKVVRALGADAKRAGNEEKALIGIQKNLATVQNRVTGNLEKSASKASKYAGALGDLGGPLGSVGQRLIMPVKGALELASALGKTKAIAIVAAVGIAAVGIAALAAGAAFIAGAVAITQWGVTLADAARTTAEDNRQLGLLHASMAEFDSVSKAVADSTGATRDELVGLGKSLDAAGVSAADMPKALEAAAQAEKALGAGGAAEFTAQIKAGTLSVEEFAKESARAFGGATQRRMRSLGAQSAKLESNLGEIFGGLKIDPLLEGLQTLVALFDENTVAGETIKFLFEEIFQPVIDAVTAAIPLVEAFFIGLLIGATKAYIALKPAIAAIKEALGFDEAPTAETFAAFTDVGEKVAYVVLAIVAAFGTLAVVAGVVVAAVGVALVAAFAIVGAAIGVLVAAVFGLYHAFIDAGNAITDAIVAIKEAVVNGFNAALDFIKGLDVVQVGVDLIAGLAKGIASGAGAVISAITGVVGGAIAAAKDLLGIASPSKLFYEMGGYTAEGYENAVQDETKNVQSAVEDMVAPPSLQSQDLAATPAVKGGSTSSVSLDNVTFQINGVPNAEQAVEQIRQLLFQILEGNLQQGGASA